MVDPKGAYGAGIRLNSLIDNYAKLSQRVVKHVQSLAANISTADPGKFLLLQFQMSQVTQIGDSISNVIGQVNSVINNAVRNQKGQ